VSGLGKAANLNVLATAQGKTRSDQAKIDAVVARGCSIDLIAKNLCKRHTGASDGRLKELEGK